MEPEPTLTYGAKTDLSKTKRGITTNSFERHGNLLCAPPHAAAAAAGAAAAAAA
eukprot:CAMPEP_0204049954 /NCGR_PEP_ID=MMETSP0360-20130528/119372_1 /ASSEMBLY_ACC=CAM_ASM_000342 /TAXON_ID=268821 /ORGANISM="Scrippsiella Hangoei, Strain SHTV-5" /LENGTH=53 /DNA_ID=CAMNT_0050996879 /DNA_START=45 /DNA_END=204 /DNA_ORIENTATION=-